MTSDSISESTKSRLERSNEGRTDHMLDCLDYAAQSIRLDWRVRV